MLKEIFFKKDYLLSKKKDDKLEIKERFWGGVSLFISKKKIASFSRKEVNSGSSTKLDDGRKIRVEKVKNLWGNQYKVEVDGKPAPDSVTELQGKLNISSIVILMVGMATALFHGLQLRSDSSIVTILFFLFGLVLIYTAIKIKTGSPKIINLAIILFIQAIVFDVGSLAITYSKTYPLTPSIIFGTVFKLSIIYDLVVIKKLQKKQELI